MIKKDDNIHKQVVEITKALKRGTAGALPPPQERIPHVNHAEFLALRTIVMSLVGTMASLREGSGAGPAQDWINDISVRCQEALLAADISGGSDPEGLRREAMKNVNHILGGVIPAKRDDED